MRDYNFITRLLFNTADAASAPATTESAAPNTAATPSGGDVSGNSSPAAPVVTAPEASWFTGFKEENKNYTTTKGFKDPEMVIESYRNLEKLLGAPKESLLKLPSDEKAPEWGDVFKKLGKPDSPDGYGIEAPKEGGAPKEFVDWAKKTFHEANLTTKQAKDLYSKWNEMNTSEAQKMAQAAEAQSTQDFDGLKSTWGNAYDQKLNVAKAGAKEFGLSEQQIDGIQKQIGYKATMELFHNIGSKIGEASFTPSATKGFSSLPPEHAQAELASLKADTEFMKKYGNGDAAAKATMTRLMGDAYPGTISIG